MQRFNANFNLLACRHGESLGNTARAAAEAAGQADLGLDLTDAELPLTAAGLAQAAWLGRRIARMPLAQRPTRIVCSPYRRALETAEGIVRHAYAGSRIGFRLDTRLQPKAFGLLEGLTRHGVAQRFPELAAERARAGRLHFRPPGGESRSDVVERVRRLLGELASVAAGERVLLVTHQIVVNALIHLLRGGSDDALATDGDGRIANARLMGFALPAEALPATAQAA